METIFEKTSNVEGVGFGECKLGDFLPQELLRKDFIVPP